MSDFSPQRAAAPQCANCEVPLGAGFVRGAQGNLFCCVGCAESGPCVCTEPAQLWDDIIDTLASSAPTEVEPRPPSLPGQGDGLPLAPCDYGASGSAGNADVAAAAGANAVERRPESTAGPTPPAAAATTDVSREAPPSTAAHEGARGLFSLVFPVNSRAEARQLRQFLLQLETVVRVWLCDVRGGAAVVRLIVISLEEFLEELTTNDDLEVAITRASKDYLSLRLERPPWFPQPTPALPQDSEEDEAESRASRAPQAPRATGWIEPRPTAGERRVVFSERATEAERAIDYVTASTEELMRHLDRRFETVLEQARAAAARPPTVQPEPEIDWVATLRSAPAVGLSRTPAAAPPQASRVLEETPAAPPHPEPPRTPQAPIASEPPGAPEPPIVPERVAPISQPPALPQAQPPAPPPMEAGRPVVQAEATDLSSRVELYAYPFSSFSILATFQTAVRNLAGVCSVKTREFNKGTLRLLIEYDDPIPLRDRLLSLEQFQPKIVQHRGNSIEMVVEPAVADAPGPRRG